MDLQKQYEYYKNKTNKYPNLIEDNAELIINKMDNRSTCYLDSEYFNEISMEVFHELKRISNKIDNNIPIIDEDFINLSDKILIIKNDIQENILYEIRKRGFKVTVNDGGIKITKSK